MVAEINQAVLRRFPGDNTAENLPANAEDQGIGTLDAGLHASIIFIGFDSGFA
jgi:hypothetical protein